LRDPNTGQAPSNRQGAAMLARLVPDRVAVEVVIRYLDQRLLGPGTERRLLNDERVGVGILCLMVKDYLAEHADDLCPHDWRLRREDAPPRILAAAPGMCFCSCAKPDCVRGGVKLYCRKYLEAADWL
jgi:hypothetical protein